MVKTEYLKMNKFYILIILMAVSGILGVIIAVKQNHVAFVAWIIVIMLSTFIIHDMLGLGDDDL